MNPTLPRSLTRSLPLLIACVWLLAPGSASAVITGPHATAGAVCSDCHITMQPGGVTYDDIEAKCLSCHNPTGQASATPDPASHMGIGCGKCHNPHRTEGNLKLIRAKIEYSTAVTPVSFTVTPSGFARGAAPYDGVCEVCHTQTNHHRNDNSGGDHTHNLGLDCTDCHGHASGFQPTGGSACTACHDQSQGGHRVVAGPSGDFSRTSHHVVGSVADADCVVCHDTSQHGGGVVRVWNADTGQAIAYTTPSDLTPFCTACHDTDGYGGTAPFSDGVLPPATAVPFAASAHGTQTGGCLDGGCHGNAHGNDQPKLLAAVEENVCYTCHAAAGPAPTDIQSEFGLAVHHDVSDADQAASGAKIECVNCHNPHVSTQAQPLVNPDQPDQLHTGAMRDFCLACHDGAPPAGVVMPAAGNGTGLDKSAFAGSTHDVQTAGNCLACHADHGSANQGIALGSFTYAAYLKTDSSAKFSQSFGVCAGCHSYNQITQTDAIFGRHDKHIKGAEAVCAMCHDPHAPYDAGENGLIDFGVGIDLGWGINLFANGQPHTLSTAFSGAQRKCWLTCHGKQHTPKSY